MENAGEKKELNMNELDKEELDQASGGYITFKPKGMGSQLMFEIHDLEDALRKEGKGDRARALAIQRYAKEHGVEWDINSCMAYARRK